MLLYFLLLSLSLPSYYTSIFHALTWYSNQITSLTQPQIDYITTVFVYLNGICMFCLLNEIITPNPVPLTPSTIEQRINCLMTKSKLRYDQSISSSLCRSPPGPHNEIAGCILQTSSVSLGSASLTTVRVVTFRTLTYIHTPQDQDLRTVHNAYLSPLSVRVVYRRQCPVFSTFRYDSLVTWTVASLTNSTSRHL